MVTPECVVARHLDFTYVTLKYKFVQSSVQFHSLYILFLQMYGNRAVHMATNVPTSHKKKLLQTVPFFRLYTSCSIKERHLWTRSEKCGCTSMSTDIFMVYGITVILVHFYVEPQISVTVGSVRS